MLRRLHQWHPLSGRTPTAAAGQLLLEPHRWCCHWLTPTWQYCTGCPTTRAHAPLASGANGRLRCMMVDHCRQHSSHKTLDDVQGGWLTQNKQRTRSDGHNLPSPGQTVNIHQCDCTAQALHMHCRVGQRSNLHHHTRLLPVAAATHPPGTLYRPAAPSHPAQAPEHTQQLPALQDSCPGHTCAALEAQHLHTTRPRCRELAPPLHKQRHRHCLKQRRLLVNPPACAPTLALLCPNTQHCCTVTVSRALLVTLRGVLPPHQPRCITGHHVPGSSWQSSSCLQLPRGWLQVELHQGVHPLTCRPAGVHGHAVAWMQAGIDQRCSSSRQPATTQGPPHRWTTATPQEEPATTI
jgi:hypothetical protein